MVSDKRSSIAIVGMACVFPGAPDLDAYLRNLRSGADCITDVPQGRLDPAFFEPGPRAIDRFYCKRGGFIDAHALFDAPAFGVMPNAARGADPDQLLSLQVATRALADAGYADRALPREKTGIILGRGGYPGAGRARLDAHVRTAAQLVRALRDLLPDLSEAEVARIKHEFQSQLGGASGGDGIGLVPNLAASRLAHRLDLHGPAFTVDAACASALVAVDQAARELASGRCDVMVSGGVHLCLDEVFWSVFCELGALSLRQESRPFDRRADGLLMGEGIGVVVLKRLADAERDGDRVYAVVRGSGVASDGRDASLMSPRIEGQLFALARAWEEAGIDPKSVGLLEAHGTGTPAGDAAELTTLARFFGSAEADRRAVLGSVKSMIGHTMPAAGAAGLIKAALAVHHGLLLPTLHCEEPNALLDQTRFRVVSREEPWENAGAPRRAGVNAFGFGGINAHVVLEEHGASSRSIASATPIEIDARVARFSAASVESLLVDLDADRERSDGGPARLAIVDPNPQRIARAKEIAAKGRPWRGRDGIWFSPKGLLSEGGTIAFLFPGLDASFEPRVDDVAARFHLPRPAFDASAEGIEQTGVGIIGVNRLLDTVLRRLGVVPSDVAGHSIGEWSGMISTGLLSEPVADDFIAKQELGQLRVPGVFFAAAGCSREAAEGAMRDLPEIALSHDNCPHQVILCGQEKSVEIALERLREEGILCQKLPFQSGFHSPLFAPFIAPHKENLARLPLEPAREPLWSATICAPYPREDDAIRKVALDHLVQPVRFRELIERLHEKGARVFVQVGTGSLVNFCEDTLRGKPHLAMSANVKDRSGLDQLRRLLAALFVEGARCDFTPLEPPRAKTGAPMKLALGVPMARFATPLARSVVATSDPEIEAANPLAAEFAASMREWNAANAEVLAQFTKAATPSVPPLARELTTTETLSIETMPEIIDHSFYPQPAGWSVLSDRHPVVPMTTSIDLMMTYAQALVPDRVPVAVEDVRAYRWLAIATPVHAKVTRRIVGPDAVHVAIGDYYEATVRFADRYPDAPAADARPLEAERPAGLTARAFYDDRWMFHGPAFQGVIDVGVLGKDGIRGELETGDARGALLDNAGQLLGYWVLATHESNRMAMPIRIGRIQFYGPHPRAGTRVMCIARVRELGAQNVIASIALDVGDRAWAQIDEWEDRRFDTDPAFWRILQRPETNTLGVYQPEGFVLFEDNYRAAPTREQLSRRFLGEAERATYEKVGPRTQRAWLSGRIAAKDAVRELLWHAGHGPIYPVEVEITSDASGRPIVRAPGRRDIRISISHKDNLAVAIAREGRDVGIDVERIEPRADSFVEIAFTPDELRLIDESARDEWLTRLWSAKEAVAKAKGTGLEGDPRRFPVRDRAGEALLVLDTWVTTKRHGDFILSWTER